MACVSLQSCIFKDNNFSFCSQVILVSHGNTAIATTEFITVYQNQLNKYFAEPIRWRAIQTQLTYIYVVNACKYWHKYQKQKLKQIKIPLHLIICTSLSVSVTLTLYFVAEAKYFCCLFVCLFFQNVDVLIFLWRKFHFHLSGKKVILIQGTKILISVNKSIALGGMLMLFLRP